MKSDMMTEISTAWVSKKRVQYSGNKSILTQPLTGEEKVKKCYVPLGACLEICALVGLDEGPSVLKAENVPRELVVGVAVGGLGLLLGSERVVVVVHHNTKVLIHVDTGATGTEDLTVAREEHGTASLLAVLAIGINKITEASGRAADADVILGTSGRVVLGVTAGDTSRVEEVVEVTVLELVGTLLAVVKSRVPGDLVGNGAANLEGSLHDDLLDITPEGAEDEDVLAADLDVGRVDAVVGVIGGNSNCAMIGPAAWVQSLGGCNSNLRVLGAELREHVVHIVLVVLIVNIGSL